MTHRPLLSAYFLRKYYPIKSENFFSRTQNYVKANKDIRLDIYEGETLGLVGESGCGKSTFGRTLIQLHEQSGGASLYYGLSPFDFFPKYVLDDLGRLSQIKSNALKTYAKYDNDKDKLMLVSPERGALRFLGGILAHSDLKEVSSSLKSAWNKDSFDAVYNSLHEAAKDQTEYEFFNRYLDKGALDLSLLTKKEIRSLRKELQIIFQDPYSSLDPRLTVKQIIGEGLITNKIYEKRNTPEFDAYIYEIMEKCGLDRSLADRYPHQFSGGQRQRIGIARAVALQPKFIVCDEAVSALDVSIQSQIINLLQSLKETEKMTYLFITHDMGVVRYISDRIGVMYFGNLVELAPAEEIFRNPLHPYTKELLNAIPSLGLKGVEFANKTDMEIEFDFNETRIPDEDWVEVTAGHFVACKVNQGKELNG